MPNHCQVQVTDIPFLDRFCKDINVGFALATFWEFYQNNMKKNQNQVFYCTTSDIARYSLEEVLAIIGKKILYGDEVKSDYCVVNHQLGYYNKISRLISCAIRSLPFVTFVRNIEGVPTYKLAVVDIKQGSNIYIKLARAITMKDAIIKNVLDNKTRYLDGDLQNIGNELEGTGKKNKQSVGLSKPILILPKSISVTDKLAMPSQSPNLSLNTLADASLFMYMAPKTYFFTRKRNQIQRDDFAMAGSNKKIIRPAQDKLNHPDKDLALEEANNIQQVCPYKYMNIKSLLN